MPSFAILFLPITCDDKFYFPLFLFLLHPFPEPFWPYPASNWYYSRIWDHLISTSIFFPHQNSKPNPILAFVPPKFILGHKPTQTKIYPIKGKGIVQHQKVLFTPKNTVHSGKYWSRRPFHEKLCITCWNHNWAPSTP